MKNKRCKTIEKRSTRTWNGGNFFIPDDEQIRKWNKGSGHLMVRSHPSKFPICGKEFKMI